MTLDLDLNIISIQNNNWKNDESRTFCHGAGIFFPAPFTELKCV